MLEFKSRPLGRPLTSEEIRELRKSMKEPRTPEESRRRLIESEFLDVNGDINQKLYPELWEEVHGGAKSAGDDQ